jgi:beta-lactamase regulating signal transducer with metallopeptidase domain/dipeptidyl aminopeptidase/acylaminoacyl peptidase
MSATSIAWMNTWAPVWAGAICRACWQGSLTMLLVWVAVRAFRRLPPRERCWLWRLAYLKWLVALLCATPVDLPLLPAPVTTPVVRIVAPAAKAPSRLTRGYWSVGSRAALSSPRLTKRPPRPSPVSALALLWLFGVGGYAFRVASEWHGSRRLRHACVLVTEERWTAACADLSRRFGVRREPRLLVAEGAGSPLLAGVIHPAIIIPSSVLAESSTAELRWILAHELAHVKRHDLGWGWLPAAVQALFFFHPFVWLARRDWELAQEVAADDLAIRVMDAPPAEYGEVLLKVATWGHNPLSIGQSGVEVFASSRTLERRLIALKEAGRSSRPSRRMAAWLLTALGVALLAPWRVVAQERITVELERMLITPSVGGIWSIAFSPDGETLASTASRVVGPDSNRHGIQEVDLWDLRTGELKGSLPAPGEFLSSLAFSPDGNLLAGCSGLAGRAGEVSLWDLRTREFKQGLPGHAGIVASAAFSPDGTLLASGGGNGTVRLWSPRTGALVGTLAGHRSSASMVAFSPDGQMLASASGSPDPGSDVLLWDLRTGTVRRTLAEARARIFSVAFSPDGQLLATGSSRQAQGKRSGEVKLWDTNTGRLQRTWSLRSEVAHQVLFSPNGRTLAVGGLTDDAEGTIADGELSLWDARSWRPLWSVTGEQLGLGAVTIAFAPDGARLASGDAHRTVRIWRIR